MTYQQYINRINAEIRRVNAENKRRIDNYNRAVDNHNRAVKSYYSDLNREIDNYNRKARQYNAEHEQRRQRLNTAIRQFNNSRVLTTRTTYNITLRQSTETLNSKYKSLELYNDTNDYDYNDSLLVDMPEQETQNSINLYNSLSGNSNNIYLPSDSLQKSTLENILDGIESDLGKRWAGALYSLNPSNPDAARHFCTSAREICTKLIDLKAPDHLVILNIPEFEIYNNRPDRRSKIKYLLSLKSIRVDAFTDFVAADVDDIQNLFRVFNDATHGSAGKLDVQQLLQLKKRVEDTIIFITSLGSF